MAAGLPDGNYKLGVNDVVVKDGDAVLASNGVRAGSTLTLAQALRNIVKFTDHPVQDVIPLMTINPAKALRMDDRKGTWVSTAASARLKPARTRIWCCWTTS